MIKMLTKCIFSIEIRAGDSVLAPLSRENARRMKPSRGR